MDFNEYQKWARSTAIYPSIGNNLWYPALGLGEAGEVQNAVKKVYRDKDGVLDEPIKSKIILELGDVLWYIAAMASEMDVSLEHIAQSNFMKLELRKQRGTVKGSGDGR